MKHEIEACAKHAREEVGSRESCFPGLGVLWQLLRTEGLRVRDGPLPYSYVDTNTGQRVIVRDRKQPRRDDDWVLWEEVGHDRLVAWGHVRQPVATGSRAECSNDLRSEAWAQLWIRAFLLPREAVSTHLPEGVGEIAELAGVPLEMVQARLQDL